MPWRVGGGWGGAFAQNFTELVVVNAHGVFSAHAAHDFDAKTVELSAKRMVQKGRRRFIQAKKQKHFLSVSVARMANNKLPPCTSKHHRVREVVGVYASEKPVCRTLDAIYTPILTVVIITTIIKYELRHIRMDARNISFVDSEKRTTPSTALNKANKANSAHKRRRGLLCR